MPALGMRTTFTMLERTICMGKCMGSLMKLGMTSPIESPFSRGTMPGIVRGSLHLLREKLMHDMIEILDLRSAIGITREGVTMLIRLVGNILERLREVLSEIPFKATVGILKHDLIRLSPGNSLPGFNDAREELRGIKVISNTKESNMLMAGTRLMILSGLEIGSTCRCLHACTMHACIMHAMTRGIRGGGISSCGS